MLRDPPSAGEAKISLDEGGGVRAHLFEELLLETPRRTCFRYLGERSRRISSGREAWANLLFSEPGEARCFTF